MNICADTSGLTTMTKKTGRPPVWTDDKRKAAQQEICERITTGETLHSICSDPDRGEHLPSHGTACKWMIEDDAFASAYARAREARADMRADRIDTYVKQVARGEIDPQQARVMIDAEKWQAGKENQRRYGDRLDLNAKVEHSDVSDEALVEKLAAILGKG
jgi:hypothetical protein